MNTVHKKSLLLAACITMILTGIMVFFIQQNIMDIGNNVKVVVAVENIKAKTVITDKQIEEVYIPQKLVIPNSLNNTSKVVGNVAKENIFSGEQIIANRVVRGMDPEVFASIIPPGYRAITIKTDVVSGINGLIRTGDQVDILVYLKPSSSNIDFVKTIFQGVEVIHVSSAGNTSQEYNFLTLCMTPQDAEKLFLCTQTGVINLVLRNSVDKNRIGLTATDLTTIH